MPDVSSTALKLHKLYTMQPPHETSLYDVLQISPNATAAQITKSYHKLSRKHHPDKQKSDKDPKQLHQVRQAYEILKDDSTRLPYHRYGLIDPSMAVILLLGPQNHHHDARLDSVHKELLQLMGYQDSVHDHDHKLHEDSQVGGVEEEDPKSCHRRQQEKRVRTIAAQLVEQVRPIVEGTVDANIVAHMLAKDCDRWKTLTLGAQIVRCIGRAIRHAGQDFLRKQEQKEKVMGPMRQQWRKAKNLATAALAAGRASVTEHVWTQQEKRQRRKKKENEQDKPLLEHDYPSIGAVDFLEDDDNYNIDFLGAVEEEEIKQAERLKARQTILHSLQVEALWKISKIDLDKTIRQACDLILEGRYFFFPSHQSLNPNEWNRGGHGWVTSSGRLIDAREARWKAAEAMVMIGEIMVQRSKEGTSWKE